MKMTAVLSPCKTYRYLLTRKWDEKLASVTWLMLNPSTADASVDDPTIRRCMGFARGWDMGGIEVVNLFPLRATNPKELKDHREPLPIKMFNLAYIADSAYRTRTVICGWGGNKTYGRVAEVMPILDKLTLPAYCIGQTQAGDPVHPLYQPKTAELRKL